jgi:glutamyl-Q tRNA(Asp) synthetase
VSYVGRFAPSPTGPLHLGSLATAVASFLHARQARGEWLVRIEDIDPPREAPGAADDILRTLEWLGLEWDRSVVYQSSRWTEYREAAELLLRNGLAFRCDCTRSALRSANEAAPGRYPGTCRTRGLTGSDTAIRVLVPEPSEISFADRLQGIHVNRLDLTTGDYIVMRRDGLPAYHLAVVLDDAADGVTSIVRGVDLLSSTAPHVHLQRTLGLPEPTYWHLPVVVNAEGVKLSKQTGAAPVARSAATAAEVLGLLGLVVPPELRAESPRTLWSWAQQEWRIDSLRGQRAIAAPSERQSRA